MPDAPPIDEFTMSDRKELIRHGLMLEELKQDLLDIKVIMADTRLQDRVRILEDRNLIMDTRMKTVLIIASLLSGLVATGVEVLTRVIWR